MGIRGRIRRIIKPTYEEAAERQAHKLQRMRDERIRMESYAKLKKAEQSETSRIQQAQRTIRPPRPSQPSQTTRRIYRQAPGFVGGLSIFAPPRRAPKPTKQKGDVVIRAGGQTITIQQTKKKKEEPQRRQRPYSPFGF